MTEWTVDMVVPDIEVVDIPGAGRPSNRAPDDTPYRDLVADALIEDVQEDRVDWFA